MGDQKYTRADVAGRNGRNGAPHWIIYKDNVYDVSAYINEHPGGVDAIQDESGKDATKEFEAVGHSDDARNIMKKYKIGEIVEKKKKGELKSPVKTSSQLLPSKKPSLTGAPPGHPSKPPVLPTCNTSIQPALPQTGLSEVPIDSSIIVPTEQVVMQSGPPVAAMAFAPAVRPNCTTVIGLGAATAANVPPTTQVPAFTPTKAPSGQTTVDKSICAPTEVTTGPVLGAASGENAEISNVPISPSAEIPIDQGSPKSPNRKLIGSDLPSEQSAVSSQPTSTNPSQGLQSASSSTPISGDSSVKPPTNPGTSSILPGLSKIFITPSKPATKPLPWSTPSQSKPNPAFKISTSGKSKLGQHDPFKKDKASISSFKKK